MGTVTIIDLGNVELQDGVYRSELLSFAAPGAIAAGTLLARSVATGKLIPFVKGGITDGNGAAKAVLTYDVSAAAAGDIPVRALVSGHVNRARLIVAADGSGVNIDDAVLDQLRDFGIVALDDKPLSALDNL